MKYLVKETVQAKDFEEIEAEDESDAAEKYCNREYSDDPDDVHPINITVRDPDGEETEFEVHAEVSYYYTAYRA